MAILHLFFSWSFHHITHFNYFSFVFSIFIYIIISPIYVCILILFFLSTIYLLIDLFMNIVPFIRGFMRILPWGWGS